MRTSILLIAFLAALAPVGAEELMFFADDHYKVLGKPELHASAINPLVEPGKSAVLSIVLANDGKVAELVAINGNGSGEDIAKEIEEEQHSVDAQNITVRLSGDEHISVISGPLYIDSLPAGSVAKMDFEISADEEASGWHDLLLGVDYEHQMDVSVFEGVASPLYQTDNASQVLGVMVQGLEGPIRILGVNSDLSPGRMGSINAIIKNSEKKSLRNCTLRLIAVPPLHSMEKDRFIGDLMPGEIAVAEFPVEAEEGAGLQEYRLACEVLHEEGTAMIAFPVALEKGSATGYTQLIIMLTALAVIVSVGLFLAVRNRRSKSLRKRKWWR